MSPDSVGIVKINIRSCLRDVAFSRKDDRLVHACPSVMPGLYSNRPFRYQQTAAGEEFNLPTSSTIFQFYARISRGSEILSATRHESVTRWRNLVIKS